MKRGIYIFLLSILAFILFMLIFLLPIFPEDAFLPKTMIGEAGLSAVHQYCGILLLTHIGAACVIPLLIELFALFHRKRDGKPMLSAFWRIPIAVILTGAYLILYPKVTHVELQTDGGTKSTFALVRAASLWIDTGKDMRLHSAVSLGTLPVDVKRIRYQYSFVSGTSTTGFSTKTGHETEFGLYQKDGTLIAQIAFDEAPKVQRSAFPYLNHTIERYEHSGLIASVDGLHQFTGTGKWEDMMTLTYDYDAGVIYRELYSDHEEDMPEMHLHVELQTEGYGTENSSGTRVNGQTKLSFKPLVPGVGKAWVEMQLSDASWQRISNIIEYTQTKTISVTLPDRGEHIARITEMGSQALLSDETYHFQMTYPAKYALDLLNEPAEEIAFGSNREIAQTAENDELYFGLYILERPWAKPVTEAYDTPPAIDSEMDDRKSKLSEKRTLLSEAREGEWRVQEWQDEDTFVVVAMYPLSEVQYAECRFVYNETSVREQIRQIMHSLTVLH